MGEAFLVANKTKKEYIYPHAFGDGYKLSEILYSARGTLAALGVLLLERAAKGHDLVARVKGDPVWFDRIAGRWGQCDIAIAGEYSIGEEKGTSPNLYEMAKMEFVDISYYVRKACGAMLSSGYFPAVEKPPFVYDEATSLFKPRKP